MAKRKQKKAQVTVANLTNKLRTPKPLLVKKPKMQLRFESGR